MSRKPTKKMIDRGVAFAWNVKLSSEYSWSQYVSDLYQHMDAGRDPAAVPGFFTSMAVSRIKRAVIDWETGLVSATESMSDVRAALAYADQQPMPPAPAVSPVDVEAVRGGSSMWTAQEAALMLANRPNQPHYIEAIINKCISAAMNRATHGRSYGA